MENKLYPINYKEIESAYMHNKNFRDENIIKRHINNKLRLYGNINISFGDECVFWNEGAYTRMIYYSNMHNLLKEYEKEGFMVKCNNSKLCCCNYKTATITLSKK